MIKRLTLKWKLFAAFITVSLIPLVLLAGIALQKASLALKQEAVAKFSAVQETKRHHIEDYFRNLRTTVMDLRDDPFLSRCLTAFKDAFEESGNTVDSEDWRIIVEFKEGRLKAVAANNGFYDLLLISPEGDIVYSVAKESDLGMRILDGPLAASSLGRAFQAIGQADEEAVVMGDFMAYEPSNGAQAAFLLTRMKNDGGDFIGYAAVQLPAEQINRIVQQRSGMGKTGESFLVGRQDGKSGLRSDRVVGSGKIGEAVSGRFIDMALAGQSGAATHSDGHGGEEFIRYDPVDIDGLDWCLITTASADEVFQAVQSLRNAVLIVILAVVVVVSGLALGVTAVIIKPIKRTVAILKDIAEGEGDLTRRLPADSRDEMGEMATWFNTFMEKLQGIIRQIAGDAKTLNDAAADLSAIAGQMSEGVGSVSSRSANVTGASEEMSANMTSVAAASEQAATNVDMVAAATEEMTATVGEIARNSEKARTITASAVTAAGDASGKVDELGKAAEAISKVTETITEISDQTNLLALNATIEAARAGEAGKGFAVVANEIKELARQTAGATQEIKQRIEGIQGSTTDTIAQIEQISSVINEVDSIVATIATAVEEQAATSREIAGNVNQASEGIQNVNQNVSQSSGVAATISGEIAAVDSAMHEIADSSGQVNQNAEALTTLAATLRELVGRFKV